MSTKTTFKRVALVAVASLGLGVLTSVAPANANDWSPTADLLDCQVGLTTTDDSATGCTQVAGGRISVGFTEATLAAAGLTDNSGAGDVGDVFVAIDGASVAGVTNLGTGVYSTSDVTTGEFVWGWDGVTDADGLVHGRFFGANVGTPAKVADTDDNNSIVLQKNAAGTAVITLFQYDSNGLRTVIETHKATWVPADSTNLASIQVSTLPGNSTGTNCSVTNKANATHNSVTQAPAGTARTDAAADMDLCVIAFDGSGSNKVADITVTASGVGLIAATSGAASAYGLAALKTSGTDGEYFELAPSSISGLATYNVSAKALNSDGVTYSTVTGSITVKFSDSKVAKAIITQKAYSIDSASDAVTVGTFVLEDKNKYAITAGSTGTGSLVVDSDISSVSTPDEAGEEDATATVTVAVVPVVGVLGTTTTLGKITVDCSSSQYEKLTIKLHYETNTVASNSITVYCSSLQLKSAAIEANNASAGTTQDISLVGIADITGKQYPVADAGLVVSADESTAAYTGATVDFLFSSGVASATFAVKFSNGKATVSYSSPLIGGPVMIKATPSDTDVAAVSKTITVAGGGFETIIATLLKKINDLAKLVAKIQKKLGVK